MGSSSMYIFIVTLQLICMLSAQEMAKRVPQGFVGMRGKKYADSNELEQFYKRKPQFFVGVKGKKNIFDSMESDQLNYKRTPMGFVGMRGKKDIISEEYYPNSEQDGAPKLGGSLIGKIDYAANDGNKNPNEINMPALYELMRYLGKIEQSNEADNEIAQTDEDLTNERISNEVDKRGANMHQFYGVRGKKSIQNKRPYDLTFRGKFIGVRGKKDVKNSVAQEIKFLLDQNGPWPKRKAQMGFFGMRGKKWTDDSNSEMETNN